MNRLILYASIQILLAVSACQPAAEQSFYDKEAIPFFIDQSYNADPFRKELVDLWIQSRTESLDVIQTLNEGWHYAIGDPARGLGPDLSQKPVLDSLLTLPHRVNRPDWPFWYEKKVVVEEPAWLFVNADDGAQVFQDGMLLEPVRGEYFPLRISPDSTRITIRVLNNALKGGLREVLLYGDQTIRAYLDSKQAELHRLLILYALKNENSISPALQSEVKQVFEGTDGSGLIRVLNDLGLSYQVGSLPLSADPLSGAFTFTAWGDSQGGWRVFSTLVKHMAEDTDAFTIGLGDLVNYGAQEEQWIHLLLALQPLLKTQPAFLVAGNHDYDGRYNDLIPREYLEYVWQNERTDTYFSWQYGGAYFVALDPNRSFPLGFDDEQRAWLESEMASEGWEAATWRFVLLHQAPYSQGWPGYHGDGFIRNLVDSLAESKRIDFVLSGHSHDYERLTKHFGEQQTHFFVLGGAGGGLEPPESSPYPEMDTVIKEHHFARFNVTSDSVKVRMYGLDGERLDQITIVK